VCYVGGEDRECALGVQTRGKRTKEEIMIYVLIFSIGFAVGVIAARIVCGWDEDD
jgi:hypothetical protein